MAYFESASGEAIDLTFNNILNDGSISVTAYIYNAATQVTTQALSHVANGFYRASYTIPTGYSKLAIYYVPSGSDNATAIDTIKIRSLSPYGALGASGGLNDDDIKQIVKALEKIKIWEVEMPTGRTAAQELIAKSEFNSEQDVVKTNVVIPPVDFSQFEKMLSSNISDVKNFMAKLVPLSNSIQKLETKLNKIDLSKVDTAIFQLSSLLPELKNAQVSLDLMANEVKIARNDLLSQEKPDINALKELIMKSDELNQKRVQVSTLSVLGLLQNVLVELRKTNGDFSKASKKFEKIQSSLTAFNLKNLQDEMA